MKLSEKLLIESGRHAIMGTKLAFPIDEDIIEATQALEAENAELLEKLAAAGDEIHELRENLEMVAKLRDNATAELARLKSHEGQWAVTCEGMTREDAERWAKDLIQKTVNGPDKPFRAVPLHAPAEDGPWVNCDCYWFLANGFNGKASVNGPKNAKRYATYADALADCGDKYKPVRLADVEREGE